MKFLYLMFIFFNISVYAISLDFDTFKADFIQQINDQNNKIVKYKGVVYAKKPSQAMWVYKKPINKTVYIDNTSVTTIEPDLEQVIIRKIHDDFNIFALLKQAKKIDNNHYRTKYKDVVFDIVYENANIKEITYKDDFDNLVSIKFSNQQKNIKIDDVVFQPDLPDDYDLIIE